LLKQIFLQDKESAWAVVSGLVIVFLSSIFVSGLRYFDTRGPPRVQPLKLLFFSFHREIGAPQRLSQSRDPKVSMGVRFIKMLKEAATSRNSVASTLNQSPDFLALERKALQRWCFHRNSPNWITRA
jgi:hypothetical protein